MADSPPEADSTLNPGVDRPQLPSEDPGFLPASPARATVESVVVRVIATLGVVGIGTAIGAILSTGHVAGWVMGLVVSLVSVILAGMLWRSRRL
jgi:hypothetical protein